MFRKKSEYSLPIIIFLLGSECAKKRLVYLALYSEIFLTKKLKNKDKNAQRVEND